MLFNSYAYILLFLPCVAGVYFWLNRRRLTTAGRTWLLAASLFFYGYWNPAYLPLLLASIGVNFLLGTILGQRPSEAAGPRPRAVLTAGILFNLGLLGYFKYADFLVANVNAASGLDLPFPNILLPIGISFFTFQQIAFLVDSYRREVREYDLLNYGLFVSFFPQLIAGPIVHHRAMMPQFSALRNKLPSARNIYEGMALFSVGLAKKAFIADTFAVWANAGFAADAPHLADAWIASLSYTFQLYFDFSGYMDMALGAALILNIRLPINFNSPYKSLSIQDFWRRWHITLGRFLFDYLYVPLGGNRRGTARSLANLLVVFLIGGLWHGAAWTFVAWGALHGLGMVVHALWRKTRLALPRPLAWATTFLFVNAAWVLFRADSFGRALGILRGMIGLNGVVLHEKMRGLLEGLHIQGLAYGAWKAGESNGTLLFAVCLLLFGVIGCLWLKPAHRVLAEGPPSLWKDGWAAASFAAGFLSLTKITQFLYFQF